ncbi:hypothetical protein KEM54_000341, partial [Ascosphaera aggregata]
MRFLTIILALTACKFVTFYSPARNAGAKNPKASFVLRTPGFKIPAQTNLDGDSADVESKYVTKGKLHAKGVNLKDFYFTYDGQKFGAPLTSNENP